MASESVAGTNNDVDGIQLERRRERIVRSPMKKLGKRARVVITPARFVIIRVRPRRTGRDNCGTVADVVPVRFRTARVGLGERFGF